MPSPRPRMTFQSINRMSQAVNSMGRDIKHVFGVESFLDTEDCRVLKKVILPYFLNDQSIRSVLFVGCDWYTRGYNKFFGPKKIRHQQKCLTPN